TIVKYLLHEFSNLRFSVSATTREKRKNETEGKDYYFISESDFQKKISAGELVEWQEVYPGKFYGTLYSELDRIWKAGDHVIFDVDVKGAENLQRIYPENSISIFIKPPSPEVLIERLKNRKTETPETLAVRLERAKMELSRGHVFTHQILNDDLSSAQQKAKELVANFLQTKTK
ncbi:MAG: guanylate kinase, partial [Chitinophagales bacterium]